MIDLASIDLIIFHDIHVKSIRIQTDPSFKLILEIFLYDEKLSTYFLRRLTFGKLNYLNIGNLKITTECELEIYSFDYNTEGDLFLGEIVLLSGFGSPSFQIDFSCRTVYVGKPKGL